MWGCCEQKDVIRDVPQKLPKGIASRLSRWRRPGHTVRFVNDDQIPLHLSKARKDFEPFGQVEGCQNLLLFQPLVHAELIANVVPFYYEEFLIELFLELALPLKGEV